MTGQSSKFKVAAGDTHTRLAVLRRIKSHLKAPKGGM
jgi:hypothetical protein